MSNAEANDALVELAIKQCTLFADQNGTPFGQVPTHVCLAIDSLQFEDYLRAAYFVAHERGVPSATAINAAKATLAAIARASGVRRPLEVRFHETADALWVDLGDETGRAVKITAGHWQIVDAPPPLFRRYSHMKALPEPAPGGSLRDVLTHVNLVHVEDQLLLLVWMVCAMRPGPRPLLVLSGGAGAAKTTTANAISGVLDPTTAGGIALPSRERHLAQVLDHRAVPVFDNISRISQQTSDALCRAITGGAIVTRKLGTDADEHVQVFQRPIILTAINAPTEAADLIDRTLLLQLERLEPCERKTMSDLNRGFASVLPSILGGLYTVMGVVLKNQGQPGPQNLERLADFHRMGHVVAAALEYSPEDFESAYQSRLLRQGLVAADGDGVATLLIALGPKVDNRFEGTMSELLAKLHARSNAIERSALPKTSAELGRRLRGLEPVLLRSNVRVTFTVRRGADGRRVEITWLPMAA